MGGVRYSLSRRGTVGRTVLRPMGRIQEEPEGDRSGGKRELDAKMAKGVTRGSVTLWVMRLAGQGWFLTMWEGDTSRASSGTVSQVRPSKSPDRKSVV